MAEEVVLSSDKSSQPATQPASQPATQPPTYIKKLEYLNIRGSDLAPILNLSFVNQSKFNQSFK
jgi:hypothetical protein